MKKTVLAMLLALSLGARADNNPWIDVSVPVEEGKTVIFPGDPPVHFSYALDLAKGDVASVSKLEMGAHTGTHIDAPSHFIKGGATIDQVPVDKLIGPALVVECTPGCMLIDAAELKKHDLGGARRVLFKTRNSAFYADSTFHKDFTALAPDAAQLLLDQGVELVGIDYPSIEKYGSPAPLTHRLLLGKGVVILEGLDLRGVSAGRYEMIALPARLVGREAAPTRALLRKL